MNDSVLFDFDIWNLQICLDEDFYELAHSYKNKDFGLDIDKLVKRYEKCNRRIRILEEMRKRDYDKEDWDRAYEDGILCLNDYYISEELKELRSKGIEKYLEYGTQEVVDKLNKEYNLN